MEIKPSINGPLPGFHWGYNPYQWSSRSLLLTGDRAHSEPVTAGSNFRPTTRPRHFICKDRRHCSVSDRKFSSDVSCFGKEPLEGTWCVMYRKLFLELGPCLNIVTVDFLVFRLNAFFGIDTHRRFRMCTKILQH